MRSRIGNKAKSICLLAFVKENQKKKKLQVLVARWALRKQKERTSFTEIL